MSTPTIEFEDRPGVFIVLDDSNPRAWAIKGPDNRVITIDPRRHEYTTGSMVTAEDEVVNGILVKSTDFTVNTNDPDVGMINYDSDSDGTATLGPPRAGSSIIFKQSGTGKLTLAGSDGVTLNSRDSKLTTAGQHAMVSAIYEAENTWAVVGDV